MEITIKELADELGVSKPTVSKAIDALGIQGELRKVGNRFVLSESQAAAVKSQILQSGETEAPPKPQEETENEPPKPQIEMEKSLISLLESQITILQEQLTVKDSQIAAQQDQIKQLTESLHDTTAALTAAQALHAGTIQQQLTDKQASHEGQAEDVVEPEQQERQGFWKMIFGKKGKAR